MIYRTARRKSKRSKYRTRSISIEDLKVALVGCRAFFDETDFTVPGEVEKRALSIGLCYLRNGIHLSELCARTTSAASQTLIK